MFDDRGLVSVYATSFEPGMTTSLFAADAQPDAGADAALRGLRVAVLHNYRDEQQPSMRLYAERLGAALQRRQVQLTRVRPFGVVPDPWRRRSALWTKVDGYVGRFAVYPRRIATARRYASR